MPLWSYPGTITGHPGGTAFTTNLDLGMRWTHPVTVHVAGIRPTPDPAIEQHLHQLLPAGTQVLAVCDRIDRTDPVRAHLHLPDGTDITNLVRDQHKPTPNTVYGGAFTRMWRYPAVVARVVDGDTTQVQLDLGVRTRLTAHVRVTAVNAPEPGTPAGEAATAWAQTVLPRGMLVTVVSHRLDKYGRILGAVQLSDGRDYATALLEAGHAVPYPPGR